MRNARALRLTVLLAVTLTELASCNECGVVDCGGGGPVVLVTASGGGPLDPVTVTLSGPTTMTLTCSATADPQAMNCSSLSEVGVGEYTLTVAAPGFQTVTVSATVTESESCGCVNQKLEPSMVALSPQP
jgi:hypothetical protein